MDILNKTNIQNKILRAPEFGEDENGGGGTTPSSSSSSTINIGGVEVEKFYLGDSANVKIYLGDTLLYPQTQPPSYKLIAQYNNTSEYKVECDGSSALTASEVSGHTTAKSAMTSAVVSACGENEFAIDTNAFYGCSAMTSVTIDNNVTLIGQQAFYRCSGLTSFTFPTGLKRIDGSAFRLANKIKTINVPSGTEFLGSGCFADMAALSSATIPSSVTELRTNVFLRDAALKTVHFQRTTAPTILADCFKNCTSLQKIYIPTCSSYDSYAAQPGLSAFTNYIYAENDTQCHRPTYQFAFKREHLSGSTTSAYTRACASSSAETLTSGATRSGTTMAVISGTSNPVTAITVGDCTKTISQRAFSGWTKVRKIVIADSVQTIDLSGFCGCSSAATTSATLDLGIGMKNIKGYAFFGACKINSVEIPSSVSTVEQYSFAKCSGLTSITINHGAIGSAAFSGCSGATVLELKQGTGNIGTSGFSNCRKITAVTIPNSTTTLNDYAFHNCTGLKNVYIGSGTTTIGAQVFIGCNSLTGLTINNVTPPDIGTSCFQGSYPIYVPASAVNTYKTQPSTSNWHTYRDRIQAIT